MENWCQNGSWPCKPPPPSQLTRRKNINSNTLSSLPTQGEEDALSDPSLPQTRPIAFALALQSDWVSVNQFFSLPFLQEDHTFLREFV